MRRTLCYSITYSSLTQNFRHGVVSWRQPLKYCKKCYSGGSLPNRHQTTVRSLDRNNKCVTSHRKSAFKRCFHPSIKYHGLPPRPPPIPTGTARVAPRVSSVRRKETFSDDDFGIQTSREMERDREEVARALREKEKREEEQQRKINFERSAFAKRSRDIIQGLESVSSALRFIKADIPRALQRGRADGKRARAEIQAWHQHYPRVIRPLEIRLADLEERLDELRTQIMYLIYCINWWQWRRKTVREQVNEALRVEDILKDDALGYQYTLHGQMRYAAQDFDRACNDIAQWLKKLKFSDSNKHTKLSLPLKDFVYLLETPVGIFGTEGASITEISHRYRDIHRIASSQTFFPERAYEIFAWDTKHLLRTFENGLVDMDCYLRCHKGDSPTMEKIHGFLSEKARYRSLGVTGMRSHFRSEDLAFYNPALNSRFGRDTIAIFRPFVVFKSALANLKNLIDLRAKDLNDNPRFQGTIHRLRDTLTYLSKESRDFQTLLRLPKVEITEELLCSGGNMFNTDILLRSTASVLEWQAQLDKVNASKVLARRRESQRRIARVTAVASSPDSVSLEDEHVQPDVDHMLGSWQDGSFGLAESDSAILPPSQVMKFAMPSTTMKKSGFEDERKKKNRKVSLTINSRLAKRAKSKAAKKVLSNSVTKTSPDVPASVQVVDSEQAVYGKTPYRVKEAVVTQLIQNNSGPMVGDQAQPTSIPEKAGLAAKSRRTRRVKTSDKHNFAPIAVGRTILAAKTVRAEEWFAENVPISRYPKKSLKEREPSSQKEIPGLFVASATGTLPKFDGEAAPPQGLIRGLQTVTKLLGKSFSSK